MARIRCSERIKEGLRRAEMTQADLCRLTNINDSTMSQYVSGRYEPTQQRLEKIAKALNVNEAWLMGYDVPESENPADFTADEVKELMKNPEFKAAYEMFSALSPEMLKLARAQLELLTKMEQKHEQGKK